MIKAVLLDLEDMLLHGVDMSQAASIRQSIEIISSSNGRIAAASMEYLVASNQLAGHRDMITSNADAVESYVAKALDLTREAAHDELDDFFTLLNGKLRSKVVANPCSVPLVNELLAQNLAVAIAAHPLYPESTIREWLDWAGLSLCIDELAFIAHSQNLHFVRPDPAYYAELVARIGVEPDETLVIANCHAHDMAPAKASGLHTRQVCESTPLASFYKQIQSATWHGEYAPSPLAADTLEPQYRGNVAALYGLLAEVKEHQWHQKPDPEEWSILQILCHLADAEVDVHQQRLRMILTDESPFLGSPPPPGPDLPPCHDDGYAVLDRFREERLKTMQLLNGLRAEDWQRPARHSIFGLTNLREMAHFTAQHDRLHITQLCHTLGKCTDTL